MPKETGILIRTIKKGSSASYQKQAESFGEALMLIAMDYQRRYPHEINLSMSEERVIQTLMSHKAVEKLLEINRLTSLELRYLMLLISNDLNLPFVSSHHRLFKLLLQLENSLRDLIATKDTQTAEQGLTLKSKLIEISNTFNHAFPDQQKTLSKRMTTKSLLESMLERDVIMQLISSGDFSFRDWNYLKYLLKISAKKIPREVKIRLRFELKRTFSYLKSRSAYRRPRSEVSVDTNEASQLIKSGQRMPLLIKSIRVFDLYGRLQDPTHEKRLASDLHSALKIIHVKYFRLIRSKSKVPTMSELLIEIACTDMIEKLIVADHFTLEDFTYLKSLITADTNTHFSEQKTALLEKINFCVNRYTYLLGMNTALLASENQ